MKALKWQNGKGDILRDFKASCEKYDILPGVYVGTRWNSFYGIHDFKVHGEGKFAENRQKYYNNMIEKTDIQRASKVRYAKGLMIHAFGQLAAAFIALAI
ncbi:MAG: hypothetical protein ABFS32_09255 [Bacteroidota bacterium]